MVKEGQEKLNPIKSVLGLTALLFSLVSCAPKQEHAGHDHVNDHMNARSFEELVRQFESPERSAYQQPEKVIQLLGDIATDTIMDLGAGTGYFTFKMAMQNAYVIAADADQRFLSFIEEKRYKLALPESILETRKVPYDDPMLDSAEVHKVLVVNTYHHINDRPAYFNKVFKGIKENGALYIIDFKKKADQYGPPEEMRVPANQVVSELEQAGFEAIELNDTLLEHQFIVTARKES
jgi:SAM-dependent methyltransferase